MSKRKVREEWSGEKDLWLSWRKPFSTFKLWRALKHWHLNVISLFYITVSLLHEHHPHTCPWSWGPFWRGRDNFQINRRQWQKWKERQKKMENSRGLYKNWAKLQTEKEGKEGVKGGTCDTLRKRLLIEMNTVWEGRWGGGHTTVLLVLWRKERGLGESCRYQHW